MKNFFTTIITVGIAMLAIMSCDEDVVSRKHVYTPEEQAYRDSVAKAKAAAIYGFRADTILVYEIDIVLDTVNYTGRQVPMDTVTMMRFFGYSSNVELTRAMGSLEDAKQTDFEIGCYAVNGSTGADYTDGMTAGNYGHWFDANGDVVFWGDQAQVFCEYGNDNFVFQIGQYPGHLAVGETYMIRELMVKDSIRIGFVFDVTVVEGEEEEEEEPVGEIAVAATYAIAVGDTVKNDWSSTPLRYDFEAAAFDLGTTIEDLSGDGGEDGMEKNFVLYAVNADGSVIKDYTANYGFWFDTNGEVTEFGTENCAFYVEYSAEDGVFNLGQLPDATAVGDVFSTSIGIVYGEKMVVYNITYVVVGVVASYDLSVSDTINWDYGHAELVFDLAMAASDLGTTTAGLTANPALYARNVDGSFSVNYTANVGYWFDSSGEVVPWSAPDCSFFIEYNTDVEGILKVGQFPEATAAGDVFSTSIGLVYEGNVVIYNVTFDIE